MAIPIRFVELFKLTNLGINPASITFSTVTLESDKYICVREKVDEVNSIAIVEVDSQQCTRHRINAESAIMNPASKVLALKSANTLQIFNLEMRSKMKEYISPEPILFWKWISVNTIALVTATAVYHWSMEGTAAPKKIFDRHPSLEGSNIINYRVDASEKWCLLIALAKQSDNSMKGVMQLYSVDRKISQPIEGHAGAFVEFKMPGNPTPTTVICIAANNGGAGKLFVMEVPKADKPANAPAFQKRAAQINFTSPADFPVAMQASEKHGVIYLITRAGFLYLFDVETATLIFQKQITTETIFVTAPHTSTDGLIGINRFGQVLSVSVDNSTIVPYITNTLGTVELAINISARAGLAGADELFITQFNNYLNQGNVEAAVKLAADSPNNILRTPQTIQRLQRIAPMPGTKPPLSIYFQYLIEKDKLNSYETVELARIVLQKPGGAQYIKTLIEQGKLEESEDLGDLIRPHDPELAMRIYLKGGAHNKIIAGLLERGEYAKVVAYCNKVGYQPDYLDLFTKLANINPDGAVTFALSIKDGETSKIDPNTVVDVFVQRNLIKQATAYLLDVLKGDRESDAALQTRLIEINLLYSPVQVADRILGDEIVTHYDKKKIAQLCEKAGLFQRALENYKDIQDIKRVIVNTHALNPDWLVNYFGNLSEEDSITCLKELMNNHPRQNLQIVVQVATKYSEFLGPEKLIAIFEQYKSYEGLFYYLGSIVNYSQDAEVHFKYIEAATRVGQYQEVERVTRESNFYDPIRVKDFLKEVKLPDQWPLINVCDRYEMEEELVHYLYTNNFQKYIELYVQKRNPLKTPAVVGALLDVDCNEDFIKNLIMSVGNMCPVEPLVEQVEKRNRLKLLLPWLEARVNEGNQDPALHNALAKIYIDTNNNAEQFLLNNPFYDSRVIGKYCEKRDPHLSFVAYKRGQCDIELVAVSNKNNMFKKQARYLVERQSPELWAHVLQEDNPYRRQVIDQVVQTALPATTNSDEVSTTVKAFMTADLPNELIELLEKIVLHGVSEFKENRNLQNLLILTAIKADKSRVMDYINRLDKYDAPDIANIAVGSDLFEEAFVIYKKFNYNTNAIRVLLDHLGSIPRAVEFAERVQDPECWSILARSQLHAMMIPEAIDSFIRANDPSSFHEVIAAAERTDHYNELIKFLLMARKKVKDSHIDTELVYSYAKTNRLADLEDFISGPNTAQIQAVGDRCYEESLYEAAKILFSSISNYARLATTLVRLEQFHPAVEAARKANSIRTWKEVAQACVDAKQFRLAQICGLHIIVHADELEELINYYESQGYFDELIALLEAGLGHERAHTGMFTELGILYSKYKPEKLMEHINLFWRRLNIPKLLNACEADHHWAAMRFLHSHYDEYDNAVKIMMEHSPEAWDHTIFKETIVKAVNMELYYKAIHFYLAEQPKLLNDLLIALIPRIDHERVVRELKATGYLPLIKPYLKQVQSTNLLAVNEALNDLYIEEEDYESLRESIDAYGNFDQLALARKLEKHELLEFRRVATTLYKKNQRWAQSVELSKNDKLYSDAMETASASRDPELADSLLRFFVENGLNECFAACLFTCYDLIRPDVAMELAWRYKINDFAMPYLIQVTREYTSKVDELYTAHKQAKEQQQPVAMVDQAAAATAAYGMQPVMMPPQAVPQGVVYDPSTMMMYQSPASGADAAAYMGFGGY
eukprot:GEZU01035605.1.p1 GENE.GEZU01035605.1~~GEZU01035605.1.p1  ORF type:complete len:1686 (+),score=716.16 GEZU01035605.1:148-5205(+)